MSLVVNPTEKNRVNELRHKIFGTNFGQQVAAEVTRAEHRLPQKNPLWFS